MAERAVFAIEKDANGDITALHNHMVHGTPELYFMHFWGEGDVTTVASGLKAALAELKK